MFTAFLNKINKTEQSSDQIKAQILKTKQPLQINSLNQ